MRINVFRIAEHESGFILYMRERKKEFKVAPFPKYFINNPKTKDYYQEFKTLRQAKAEFKKLAAMNENYVRISDDKFTEYFKPIKNHFETRNGAFDDCVFETYGKEHEFVREFGKQHPNQVWTYLSGDKDCIVSGYHLVNRLGYLLTEKPYNEQQTVDIYFT